MKEKTRIQRWLMIVGATVLGLLLLLVLTFVIVTAITTSALERTIADHQAQGFRTSPKDLIPVCSDDENAALPWEQARAQFNLGPAAADIVYGTSFQDWASQTPQNKQVLRAAIAANKQALDLIREAVARPCFTFTPDYAKPMDQWLVPKITGMTYLMRLLILTRGRLALEEGNWEEALDSCLLGIKSARSYGSLKAYLIHSLMSLLFFDMSLELCQETIAGRRVPHDAAQEMIRLLDPGFLKESIITALDMERLLLLDSMTRMLAGENISIYNHRLGKAALILGRPIVQTDTALLQKLLVRQIKAIQHPYGEAKKTFMEIANEVPNLSKVHYFARAFFSLHRTLPDQLAVYGTEAQVTRLALACKLFADEQGEFPTALEQLTPTYFKELPRDPFTGTNFIYRRLPDGGFVVYSVGANGKDDLQNITSRQELQKMVFSAPAQSRPNDDIAWLEPR